MHTAILDARDLLEQVVPDRLDPLDCDRCDGIMEIRSTQVQENPCRNDIRVKCMECYWWTRHGVPISRETYEFEMDRRDHRLVDAVNTDDGDREFEERLEALGYLDA
jgi:hypothetical protein